MEAYGVIGWCSCFISSPWGVFPYKALSIVHQIVIAIAANMLVDILLIVHRQMKDQLIQCYSPFIPQQMVRLLACIYRRLHGKKRKTNKAFVGVKCGRQVNIYSFAVHCDRMWPSTRWHIICTGLNNVSYVQFQSVGDFIHEPRCSKFVVRLQTSKEYEGGVRGPVGL